jgi:hypothetical protein
MSLCRFGEILYTDYSSHTFRHELDEFYEFFLGLIFRAIREIRGRLVIFRPPEFQVARENPCANLSEAVGFGEVFD